MGLIQCIDCGNWVSDRATACPTCGCPAEAYNKHRYYDDQQSIEHQNATESHSIIAGVAKTALGVALGNRLSQNSKMNYMNSANCERAKTGRVTTCFGCGLRNHCTMFNKR